MGTQVLSYNSSRDLPTFMVFAVCARQKDKKQRAEREREMVALANDVAADAAAQLRSVVYTRSLTGNANALSLSPSFSVCVSESKSVHSLFDLSAKSRTIRN